MDKRRRKVGAVTRRQLKKVITLQSAMTKKGFVRFSGKWGKIGPTLVTPLHAYLL